MIAVLVLIIGVAFVVIGIRDKAKEAGEILTDDFTGQPSFIAWIAAVVIIAVITSYGPFKRVGAAFYGLLLIVLFLSNDGFFKKFSDQIGVK
jgi:hypothetical protein